MLLRQLTYLVTLSQEKHFGGATQPPFRGFTADGEKVLVWARRILADCGALRQAASNRARDPASTLRLGAIPTVLSRVPLMTDSMMALYGHVRCSGLYSVVPHSVLALSEMRQEITAIPTSDLRTCAHIER